MRTPTSWEDRDSCPRGGRCPKKHNSCNALPHCMGQWRVQLLGHTASLPGKVGSATAAIHCLTATGQWAVELLQRTASLPAGGGQWNSCNQGFLPRRRLLPKQRISCNTLPRCLGAVGGGTPAIHCLTTWGHLGNPFPEYTASRPRGTGEWNSYNALPHCLRGGGQWKSCNTRAH